MDPFVSILFAEPRGVYSTIAGVDLWDVERDARKYVGPRPVAAHPPCARWSKLAGLVEACGGPARYDDGGCFVSALTSVHTWGGVLEHPQYSAAWNHYGLRTPRLGVWLRSEAGWVTEVMQVEYGHRALKPTWLYVTGDEPCPLRWRQTVAPTHPVMNMGTPERKRTPRTFAYQMISLAAGSRPVVHPPPLPAPPGGQLSMF